MGDRGSGRGQLAGRTVLVTGGNGGIGLALAEYPVSRPLFFYIKKAHIGVIPGLKEYAEFFVSDEIAGPKGPLAAYGLVSDPELAATQQEVAGEKAMGM